MRKDKRIAGGRRTLSKRLAVLVASAIVVTQIASITTPVFANDNIIIQEFENNDTNSISNEVYTVLFDGIRNM